MSTTSGAARKSTARKAPVKKAPAKPRAAIAEATGTLINLNFRGFDLVIDPELLDDYEVMAEMRQGSPFGMVDALIPDGELRMQVLETCREGGRIRLTLAMEMLGELMEEIRAGK